MAERLTAVGGDMRGRVRWWAVFTAVLVAASFAVISAGSAGGNFLTDVLARVLASATGAALILFTIDRFQSSERGMTLRVTVLLVGVIGGLALWYGYLREPKVRSTIIGVLVAIGVSAGLFVGANKWIDMVRKSLPVFGALTGFVIALASMVLLVGNRLVGWQLGGTNLSWLLVLIVTGVAAATGYVLGRTSAPRARVLIGAVGGLLAGLLVGIYFRPGGFPAMFALHLTVWPLALAAAGAGLASVRNRPRLAGAVTGAIFGWFIGAWLMSRVGAGTIAEAVLGAAVMGGLIGLRYGLKPLAGTQERLAVERRARAVIFLAPALTFIIAALVVPSIITTILSFRNRDASEVVGFANYLAIFRDPNAVNVSGWTEIFTSGFFWGAVILAAIGIVAGVVSGRRVGRGFDAHGGSIGPLAAAIFLLAFSLFTNLRGTIFNNLWWVFTVTILAAGLGLAVAVLADRAKNENVAKSIIFMPMAISFVGASLIWRFVYIARPPQKEQTGLANAVWVGLGSVSADPLGKTITLLALAAILVGLGFLALRARRVGASGLLAGTVVLGLPVLYLMYRFASGTIGGVSMGPNGEPIANPWQFITTPPINNFWLMVVLIWIQTGFTMVIFSAAIKAVPSELIEASRVDGATESQTFWRVTVPQIAPTIGVVVTTLIVLVMKVFDIVKVMTNGNFDTQVIANLMWTRGFSEFNRGLGSALAVVLFLSVLPVMIINIRRMQKEAR
ncbi:MAG TPA: sugar ABC transporter permease [Acidimicrobiia bacterium]|nr:sugar ABC transporter permease [Acidimicrobiia bacterium]